MIQKFGGGNWQFGKLLEMWKNFKIKKQKIGNLENIWPFERNLEI